MNLERQMQRLHQSEKRRRLERTCSSSSGEFAVGLLPFCKACDMTRSRPIASAIEMALE